jgi:hypothetical protein
MYGLFYSAIDIAFILQDLKLGCREESKILDSIWENEKAFLSKQYRDNKRKFLLDIYHWKHYILDKDAIDEELDAIKKECECSDRILQIDQLSDDLSGFDNFFKSCRIKILYGGSNYMRIKLRTLLKRYGYKRRSSLIVQYIKHSLLFYHLEVTLRGGETCDIETVGIDEMLIFRVIS